MTSFEDFVEQEKRQLEAWRELAHQNEHLYFELLSLIANKLDFWGRLIYTPLGDKSIDDIPSSATIGAALRTLRKGPFKKMASIFAIMYRNPMSHSNSPRSLRHDNTKYKWTIEIGGDKSSGVYKQEDDSIVLYIEIIEFLEECKSCLNAIYIQADKEEPDLKRRVEQRLKECSEPVMVDNFIKQKVSSPKRRQELIADLKRLKEQAKAEDEN